MIDKPELIETKDQHVALIRLTIPREKMRDVMGPALGELMGAVGKQNIGHAGPWFTHHMKMDPAEFDFEICVPVVKPVAADGRVVPGVIAGALTARTVYGGPYEGLGAAWGEFDSWIAAQGHAPAGDLWEVYVVRPENDADPAALRTQLNRPLLRKA